MSEKVVVPKFEIPSETTHPAIKAVAAIGVLLLATTAILGIAIMHRRSEQEAAVAKRDAIIAARAAEAKAAEEKAKAEVIAKELAVKEAARKAEEAKQAKLAAAKAAAAEQKLAAAEADNAGDGHHHHHHGKASAKGKSAGAGAAAVASKSGDDKKSGPKSTRDNAAIDKLLASFK
jgi:colicin import membrane protein